MDAAHKFLNKTALFLATALLTAAPALAQSQLIVSSTTVGLNDNQAKSISVTASGSTALSYTISGVPFWLSVFSSNGFITPDTLFIQLSNTNCGSCTATVTLTPSGGGTAVPITVSYTPGGNGGGGSGIITASQTTLNFSAGAGQSAPTQNISLSSTSTVSVIGIGSDQTTWLSAAITAGSFTIGSGTPATLTISASAFSLNAGTYTGHITITPNAGTNTVITVNFVVGGSGGGTTGTIVANQSSLTFNAVAGQVSLAQNLTLSSNSTSPVGVIFTAPDATWLVGGLTQVSGSASSITSATPLTISIVANAAGLTNGTYNGHLTIAPTDGTTPTVIPVTLIVGNGSGGSSGTVVASSTNLSFAANSGQLAPSQNVTLTSNTAVSFSVSSDVTWLTAGVISGSTNIGPSSGATLQVSASAFNLNNGTYTGHITISPISGTATVILVTFTVGTGGGGGGTQGTITASQTSLQLQYPNTGSPANVTIGTSNALVTSFNVDVASQSNWLRFAANNLPAGHYTNGAFGTYVINVDQTVAASLGTGTYTGTLTFSNPNNSNDTTVISVTLTVNGGGGTGGGLSASQGTLNFTASPGGAAQQQNFTIAAPSGATVQFNATSFNGGFFSISSQTTPGCGGTPNNNLSCTLVGSQTFTVTVNPGSLNNLGTYSAQLQFQSGTSAPVNVFVVMTLSNPVTTLTAGSQSLAFSAVTGGAAQTQGLAVSVPGQAFVQVSASTFNGNFFSVSSNSCSNITPTANTTCSFSGNQTLYVTVNPSSLTAAGTYNGIITLQSGGSTITVPVNLTLTTSGGGGGTTAAIAAPPSLTFAYQTLSTAIVPQQVITIAPPGTFSASGSVSTAQQWLSVSPVGNTGPGYAIVSVSPQGLAVGTYQGNVSIISAGGSTNIPVTLTVTSGVVVEATPATIYFTYQGGSASIQQPLTLVASDNSATPVTASTTASWISIGAANSANTAATFPLTINPSTLCNGLNVGTIAISAPNAVNNGFTIPVVVLVTGSTATTGCSGGGGTSPLSVTATSLTYTYQPGANTPAGQSITVTSANGTAGVSFTYSLTGNLPITAIVNGTTIQSGQTLTTPATITFTPAVSGLTPGSTYSDTVTLAPIGGGTSVPITLSLTVSNTPVVSAPSTPLTFTYNAGAAAPSSQTVQVSGGSGLAFSATATSSGNWLSVSPATGTTPQTLTVSVNPTGLAANTYNGTIVVAGTGTAGGSTTIPVTLTVTAPLPTITSLGSAASYLGGSISPGEIITIFGTSIGPTPGVSLALDSTGKVATTLAGVQVLVNGFLSPMVFASNTQVSAVVPYELCANSCGAGTIAQVVVKFLGQSSNGIPTPVASTTTGIFTANASGSGPGAILNANLSANSPSSPANKGDVVAIYLTGEGQTSPAGVTGKVTTVSSTGPLTPVPLLPVAVLIDGQPASISFAGEAPGLVSGAMQLNVQIPPGARSGNLSLVVTIGSVSSQAGVTVSVR